MFRLEIMSRGVWVYAPRRYTGRTPLPTVMLLHGSGQNGREMLGNTDGTGGVGLQNTAESEGFLIVAPSGGIPAGDKYSFSWQVPGAPGGGPGETGDERFLSALIAKELPARLCVDPARAYMAGFSGGARMTSQFACRHDQQLAAIGAVSGLRAGTAIEDPPGSGDFRPDERSCPDTVSMPVVAFHNTGDPENPYGGDPGNKPLTDAGGARWGYSVPEAHQRWGRINGCTVPPPPQQNGPLLQRLAFGGCEPGTAAVLFRLDRAKHDWPRPPVADTNGRLWAFFCQFPQPCRT